MTTDVPGAVWKRRLDQQLETPGLPRQYTLVNALSQLGVARREKQWVKQTRKAGREPYMDPFNPPELGPVQGVPLGGLGGGTITRGWQGGFTRWQMQAGMHEYRVVPVDQFSVFIRRVGRNPQTSVLYPGELESGPAGWGWNLSGSRSTYHALFPRAWTVYEEPDPNLKLTCRQISPVIPHNYEESSTPAGVFAWTIENTGEESATVGLMFTFQNGTGGENDRKGGHHNQPFRVEADGGEVVGVALNHIHRMGKPLEEGQKLEDQEFWEDPLTFAIAAQEADGVEVTYRSRFVTTSSCMDIWTDFRDDGKLQNLEDDRPSGKGTAIGAAVAATVEVPADETREVVFSLAWDMPQARFGDGTVWNRRYTRTYGTAGDAAPTIARDALVNYPEWEKLINAWQKPVLDDETLPDWYRAALFNELYFLTAGGTVWVDPVSGAEMPLAKDDQIGKFAYLEGHEYRMYNTYDVHFYASFALAMLWPEIELSIQRDFAAAVALEDLEERRMNGTGKPAYRKTRGMVPHDIGGPTEDPWHKLNIYNFQDSNRWKDLNPKFVLQVYRDYVATGNKDFLAEVWDAVKLSIEAMEEFDLDGDGMIENEGFPDQTYDTWTAEGPSAYCGGLWIACLSAAAAMADELGEKDRAEDYRARSEKAAQVYEELLWNGDYYDYDTGRSAHSASVMADQLAGQWYVRACGLPNIAPEDNIKKAFDFIQEYNIKLFQGGEMGAINGMRADGRLDTSSDQAQEVWVGTNYALAAAMIQEGLGERGFELAKGVVNMTYKDLGYWFQTPESWDYQGNFRSLAYMRPLAIWAMQWALQNK